jgi:arylamine N-acetyltransferase
LRPDPFLALIRRAALAVPFENLSIHLAEPISLAEGDLTDKIVRRRRGGFCYELNGAFALLLEALGMRVSRVAARVYGAAGLSPPFDHLALVVRPADGAGPGSPTSASGATATIRCSWTPGVTRTIRRAGSGSPAPMTVTSTSRRTASPSTASRRASGPWPTASRPAGGSRPRRCRTSPAARSAPG